MRNNYNIGAPPGTVKFTGEQKVEHTVVHTLSYNKDEMTVAKSENSDETVFVDHPGKVDWYDVRGLHDEELVNVIGTKFGIHQLIREDIVDPYQRSKFEVFDNGIFFLCKSMRFDQTERTLELEQVSFYFTDEYLISFQEDETDLFHRVRDRIVKGYGKIRQKQGDYLAFALLDTLVDDHFLLLELINEGVESLEEQLLIGNTLRIKEVSHGLRRTVHQLRKEIISFRDGLSMFKKSESEMISDDTRIFLNDLFGQVMHQVDIIDNQRELLNGIQELYNSEMSNKMNQIMKVLTIITTVFVPLSFLAGLYGMNFKHIPELEYQNGYYILLVVMAIIVLSSLWFFKKNRWL